MDANGTAEPGAPNEPSDGSEAEPGNLSEQHAASLQELLTSLAEVQGIDRDGLKERYPAEFGDELGDAPREAQWFDLIQSSALGLNDAELAVLDQHGFVICDRQSSPKNLL